MTSSETMSGCAVGLFVYAYCFYYYAARSDMSGFMQQAFYFGYMFMVRCSPHHPPEGGGRRQPQPSIF